MELQNVDEEELNCKFNEECFFHTGEICVTKQAANKVVVVGVSFLVHSFRLLERNCISYYHNIHLIIQQREVPSSLGVP